jgi:exodeoxyribonuclease X
MLNAVGIDQLLAWSSVPGLLPRVRQGPDRGKEWSEASDETIATMLEDRDEDVRFTAETERARRRAA